MAFTRAQHLIINDTNEIRTSGAELVIACDFDNRLGSSATVFTVDGTERARVNTSGLSVTGTITSSGRIQANYANPLIQWYDTAASADNKRYDWQATGASLVGRIINDADTVATTWMTLVRSGTTLTSLNFVPDTSISGKVGLGGATAAGIGTYVRQSVSPSGTNAVSLYVQPTYNLSANNDSAFGIYVTGTVAKSTFTGLSYYGMLLNTPGTSGTGTIANAYQLYIAANPSATNQYAIFQNASGERVYFNSGVELGSPTGGNKGSGTLNAAGDIYKNNTAYTNPDYVLEHWATGRIEKFANKEGAKDYDGLRPIHEIETFIRRHWHLPRFGQNAGHGIFSGGDAMLASLEEAYLYIIQLEKRIAILEAR